MPYEKGKPLAFYRNPKLSKSKAPLLGRTELASRLEEDEGKIVIYLYIWLLPFGLSAFYIYA